MSKHTPGPWKISERIKEPGKIDFIRIGREDYDVARVICYGDNAEANARLIAAAPEMLEALKALLAAVEKDDTAGTDSYARNFAAAAERAIAKAEAK